MNLPDKHIDPLTWARATRQPPSIIRLAKRLRAANRVDPHSWATLKRLSAFYSAINEPVLASQSMALAHIRKRSNRVLAISQGSTYPVRTTMASTWTLEGRTFSITMRRDHKRMTIVELPSPDFSDIHKTHALYHRPAVNTFLFLRGAPTYWPDCTLVKPITPPTT